METYTQKQLDFARLVHTYATHESFGEWRLIRRISILNQFNIDHVLEVLFPPAGKVEEVKYKVNVSEIIAIAKMVCDVTDAVCPLIQSL